MVAVLEKASTIYKKGQTTVPVEVRNALGVVAGDSVTFCVERNGTIIVRKTEETRDDPAMAAFLEFLRNDIQQRPERIRPITKSLEDELRSLTATTRFDREDDRIEGDVGL